MWYIFKEKGECVGECDFEPNLDDLATRGEIAIESEQHYELSKIYFADNQIQIRPESPSPFHAWQPEKRKWFLSKAAEKQAFQAAQTAKIAELNRVAQNFINEATGADKLPEFEVQSWKNQADEARAWAADSTIATPILDQIALERGISSNDLKQKVLEKAKKSDMIVAAVVGQRQAWQDKIDSVKTLDELNAIEITFHLPESK